MLTFSTAGEEEKSIIFWGRMMKIIMNEPMRRTHWTFCSARSPCTGGALAPAAPTSRSSPSSWQSSWPGSLWAGARRGFLSPPRCPGQTETLWSSSVLLDWPKPRNENTLLHTVILSFLVTLQTSCKMRRSCTRSAWAIFFLPLRYFQFAPGWEGML